MNRGLHDRVAIVTGGSRGLGLAMADALLGAGCRVLVTALREPEALREVEAASAARHGPGRLVGVRADVASPEDCERVAAQALATFGRVDVLVNNAGLGSRAPGEPVVPVSGHAHAFWNLPVERWRATLRTNLDGAFFMARAVAPGMVARGFGRIVNISTSAATMLRPTYSNYGASKAGLEAATACWAHDLARTGVTCNLLLPGGATDTRIIPGTGADRATFDGQPLLSPDIMRAPIVWLASDDSAAWTNRRLIAKLWDPATPAEHAALAALSETLWSHVVPGTP